MKAASPKRWRTLKMELGDGVGQPDDVRVVEIARPLVGEPLADPGVDSAGCWRARGTGHQAALVGEGRMIIRRLPDLHPAPAWRNIWRGCPLDTKNSSGARWKPAAEREKSERFISAQAVRAGMDLNGLARHQTCLHMRRPCSAAGDFPS